MRQRPRFLYWFWPRGVSIRITKEGVGFVILIFLIEITAINTGNNLLYLILSILLGFIIASGLFSRLNLRRLQVERHLPAYTFANQPFRVRLRVRNGKRVFTSYVLRFQDMQDQEPVPLTSLSTLPPQGRREVAYERVLSRRGRHRFSGVRLASAFPFGLFLRTHRLELSGEVIAFPQLLSQPLPLWEENGSHAPRPTPRRGRGEEFYTIRQYTHGDNPKLIHWKSSAKSGRLMMQEFQQELDRRATLLLADRPGELTDPFDPRRERAISLCATVASRLIAQGFAVQVLYPGGMIPHGQGRPHLLRILRALALYQPPVAGQPWWRRMDGNFHGDWVAVISPAGSPRGLPYAGPYHLFDAARYPT